MIRVRHYTRISSMRKIVEEMRIVARDQNKVFVESAQARKLAPADAIRKYRLAPGKGNAYVEFDIEESLVIARYNPSTRCDELVIEGSIDLTDRNTEAFFNF